MTRAACFGGIRPGSPAGRISVDLDKKNIRKYISKSINVPFVRLAWPVTWEVCRGDVGDGLGVDVDDLKR